MIPRGTTPSITFNITAVQIADIAVAYLTIQQDGAVIIEKDLSAATAGETSLTWDLTQAETLVIDDSKMVSVQLRYKTTAGKAYASKKYTVPSYEILKDGEI